MRYKEYEIRRVDRKASGFTVRVNWDIYRGEVRIKANFATRLESLRDSKSAAKPQTADGKIKDFDAAPLEMAKHYIDLVQGGDEGEEG